MGWGNRGRPGPCASWTFRGGSSGGPGLAVREPGLRAVSLRAFPMPAGAQAALEAALADPAPRAQGGGGAGRRRGRRPRRLHLHCCAAQVRRAPCQLPCLSSIRFGWEPQSLPLTPPHSSSRPAAATGSRRLSARRCGRQPSLQPTPRRPQRDAPPASAAAAASARCSGVPMPAAAAQRCSGLVSSY